MYTTFNIIKNKLNIKDIIVVKIVLLKTKYAPSGKTNLVKYSEFANKILEMYDGTGELSVKGYLNKISYGKFNLIENKIKF